MLSVPTLDALVLSGLFGASGLLHMTGPGFVRRAYRSWGFPGNAHRVVGVLQILAALFLSNPVTRIWGVILAGFVIFFATVALLGWLAGPFALVVFAAVGFVGYWRARRAGLTRSKCLLRDTRLVLAYLAALAVLAGLGIWQWVTGWLH